MDIRELSGIPDKELRGGVWGVTLRENGIFSSGSSNDPCCFKLRTRINFGQVEGRGLVSVQDFSRPVKKTKLKLCINSPMG